MDLFAYGTLEIEALMERIAGRKLGWLPARLPGYGRALLQGRPYPGIAPLPGGAVLGRLWLGIDPPTLARLDDFEDVCYERTPVTVRTPRGSRRAFTYVVKPDHRHLLGDEPWNRDRFLRRHGLAWGIPESR